MRKLIHSKFELDLSKLGLSEVEENNWFSDSFFTKYSFPFEIDLDDVFDEATGFISMYNSSAVETYFEVKYVHNNQIEDAIFEVESYQNKLSCVVRFGFEQLPSWDKKLSELSLEKFDLPSGVTIFAHAQSVITKTWPEVNYNFPQIHVDKYDPEDDLWTVFEKILNNRVDGLFLENTVDTLEDVTYNRNIMQPLPYWIHILQRIMADAGFTLAGDILNDPRLKVATLYGDVDYFTKPTTQEPITVSQISEDAITVVNARSLYQFKTTLLTPGKYSISGTVRAMRRSNFKAYFIIKYRNTVLYSIYASDTSTFHGSLARTYNVDVEFETLVDLNPNEITIENFQPQTTETPIHDLTIALMRVNDSTGVAIPTIINENKIDLTKAVPNKTAGDFVKDVKNWFNYDLTIIGKLAVMNPIEDQINYEDAVDLSFTEVRRPQIKFSQGISFLLKFQDIESKDYKYLPVFHDKENYVNSNYTITEKTTTIEIAALPLPMLSRKNIQTAYALEGNDSKTYLVVYDGLYNGNNLAKPIDEYLLPEIHLAYWLKWFNYRINARGFTWGFTAWNEDLLSLKAKSKIFAYNKHHIVKSINKTEVVEDSYDVEIEVESLE